MLQLYSLNGDFMAAKNHFSDLTQLLESQLGVAPEELTIECFHKLSLADYKPVNRLSNNFQNLPYKADDFVGRENELEAIRTILENYSLITLHAWGGVGKTRLALAFAERYKDLFKDGVLYISLTNQRYDNALDYFREALQLESSTVSDIIEDLKHFFSQRHLLLVIDNAEEYVEDLAILNQFLEASPELKIVVTSRVALGLQTEHQYPVQGLSLPVSVEDLKASESYELLESRMNLRAVPEDLDNTLTS